jgi:hypothetical protein
MRPVHLGVAGAAAALAITSALVSGPEGVENPGACGGNWFVSGDGYREVRSSTYNNSQTVSGAAWTSLECGSVTVNLPRGRSGQVTVWVNAEIRCGTSGGWCAARVLAGGRELEPGSAGDGDEFAWDTAGSDRRHRRDGSLVRTGVISCPTANPAATCPTTFTVQARNSAGDFWIDDLLVRAEVNEYNA